MCGIAGVVSESKVSVEALDKAAQIQKHRGPDASGAKVFSAGVWNVGLAHQRLKIIDLSDAANQPMELDGGKSAIIYNGEVYNYIELRLELEGEGYRFKTSSDTEVVLNALDCWGVEGALNRFNGMWAFAWFDAQNKKVVLARDRVGVKPLNYALLDGKLYFASEVKTIIEMSGKRFALNRQVIGRYLVQSLLETSDETFFKGINKIPAASYAILDLKGKKIDFEIKEYWRIPVSEKKPGSEKEVIEKVRELFIDSVKLRLRSDVPVGVLLSGGVDSSSIASVMNGILGKDAKLNLLSAVSKDGRFDESMWIDLMASSLGKEVHKVELDMHPDESIEYLRQACRHNDGPVGSFSNVAHYLLMRQARELGITVILSGQGADELLCGYKRYLGFYLKGLVSAGSYLKAFNVLSGFGRRGTVLSQFTFAEAKRYLPGFMQKDETDILGESLKEYLRVDVGLSAGMTMPELQAKDIKRLSVPMLVHYEDRMSMAWSREIRVPFLDYRLIETLVPLATDMKIKDGWTKYVFRKAMEDFLPAKIAWRKDKQGFVNPQSEWLKNELKGKVKEFFSPDSLMSKYGLVNVNNLLLKYDSYCRQSPDRGRVFFREIFNPLALEVWLRNIESFVGSP